MTADSTITIGLILPEVLGTYGDSGNATVLAKRLEWRGIRAEIKTVGLNEPVPSTLDLYLMGGGEDDAQTLAADHLRASPGLQRGVDAGATVFGVCAGLQVLGTTFTASGATHDGLGLLDVRTSPGPCRAVSEVVTVPDGALLTGRITGFENHLGRSTVGAGSKPIAKVRSGTGNGDGTEGATTGKVLATYLHGPVLARNPELCDLLLSWVVGERLSPLDVPEVTELRRERLGKRVS